MKRGQRAPWKVRFVWDTGVSGKVACSDEWTANHKADEIRRNADLRDREVTVTVSHEPTDSGVR